MVFVNHIIVVHVVGSGRKPSVPLSAGLCFDGINDSSVSCHALSQCIRLCILPGYQSVHICFIETRASPVVGQRIVYPRGKLHGVHHLLLVYRAAETETIVVVDRGFSIFSSAFCSDKNYPERCARTINRRSGGIFQNRDIGNILRVYAMQLTLHTVNQNQRCSAGTFTNRCCSAYIDIGTTFETTVGNVDIQTGDQSLKCLCSICNRTFL